MKCLKPIYNILYYIVFILFGWAVRLLYPLRVYGKENLVRGSKPFVLAPNHLFAIDPMYILLARWMGKKVLVMGKDELFGKNPFLDVCWNIFGAFPIKRGTGDTHTLDEVEAEMRKGRGLLLFPEGKRSKDGALGHLKSGAFVVAWKAEAPIIPCYICYSAGKPKLFRRITVTFGPQLTPQQLGFVGDYTPGKLKEGKRMAAKEMEALQARCLSRDNKS